MESMTNAAITTAVKQLAAAPITNTRIQEIFADLLPAEYVLRIQEPAGKLISTRSWEIQGPTGTLWFQRHPVQPGKGAEIIANLINAAWQHATESGRSEQTRTQQTAEGRAAIRALPTCPECGKTVLPEEAITSSVTGHHRNCA